MSLRPIGDGTTQMYGHPAMMTMASEPPPPMATSNMMVLLAGREFLTVVDPLSCKLDIPIAALSETQAMNRQGMASLCQLHLQQKCRQGVSCRQVHADATVVERLRREVRERPSCCRIHGDSNNHFYDELAGGQDRIGKRCLYINDVMISIRDSVGFTNAVLPLLESPGMEDIIVTPAAVCRLHVAENCRFGRECKFLHVCRQVVAHALSQWVQPQYTTVEMRKRGAPPSAVLMGMIPDEQLPPHPSSHHQHPQHMVMMVPPGGGYPPTQPTPVMLAPHGSEGYMQPPPYAAPDTAPANVVVSNYYGAPVTPVGGGEGRTYPHTYPQYSRPPPPHASSHHSGMSEPPTIPASVLVAPHGGSGVVFANPYCAPHPAPPSSTAGTQNQQQAPILQPVKTSLYHGAAPQAAVVVDGTTAGAPRARGPPPPPVGAANFWTRR